MTVGPRAKKSQDSEEDKIIKSHPKTRRGRDEQHWRDHGRKQIGGPWRQVSDTGEKECARGEVWYASKLQKRGCRQGKLNQIQGEVV